MCAGQGLPRGAEAVSTVLNRASCSRTALGTRQCGRCCCVNGYSTDTCAFLPPPISVGPRGELRGAGCGGGTVKWCEQWPRGQHPGFQSRLWLRGLGQIPSSQASQCCCFRQGCPLIGPKRPNKRQVQGRGGRSFKHLVVPPPPPPPQTIARCSSCAAWETDEPMKKPLAAEQSSRGLDAEKRRPGSSSAGEGAGPGAPGPPLPLQGWELPAPPAVGSFHQAGGSVFSRALRTWCGERLEGGRRQRRVVWEVAGWWWTVTEGPRGDGCPPFPS